MQQISLPGIFEWETTVYFCPLFAHFKTLLTTLTNSAMGTSSNGEIWSQVRTLLSSCLLTGGLNFAVNMFSLEVNYVVVVIVRRCCCHCCHCHLNLIVVVIVLVNVVVVVSASLSLSTCSFSTGWGIRPWTSCATSWRRRRWSISSFGLFCWICFSHFFKRELVQEDGLPSIQAFFVYLFQITFSWNLHISNLFRLVQIGRAAHNPQLIKHIWRYLNIFKLKHILCSD